MRTKILIVILVLLVLTPVVLRTIHYLSKGPDYSRLTKEIEEIGGRFNIDKKTKRLNYIILDDVNEDTSLTFLRLVPNDLKSFVLNQSDVDLTRSDFRHLNKLERLSIWKSNLQRPILSFANFPSLKELVIDKVAVPDGFLDEFSSSELKLLQVMESDVSNSFFKSVALVDSLEEIALLRNNDMDGNGINQLAELQNLRTLRLIGSNLTDLDFRRFKSPIDYLELRATNIDDNTLRSATVFKDLKFLNLTNTNISDSCLETITSFKKLEFLGVAGTNISKDFCNVLDELPNLKTFATNDSLFDGSTPPTFTGWQVERINEIYQFTKTE